MPRTTLDLDAEVLRELKRIRELEGKSLGAVASELLARALHERGAPERPFAWNVKAMGAKVDLRDSDAVYRAMEHD